MLRRSLLALPAALAAGQTATTRSFPAGIHRGHVLVYDSRRKELLLFGGTTPADASGLEPLWILSGSSWRHVDSAGPRERSLAGGAYDARRGRFVVYGGISTAADTRYGDVWEWDGQRWEAVAKRGPGPRDHHAMAYDSARDCIVLHGGSIFITPTFSTGTPRSGMELWYEETWEYDGSDWKPRASPGPGARAHHCVAYDPIRKLTMLTGGVTRGNVYARGTWGWDGSAWKGFGEGGPDPRARCRMAFHEPSGEMVLYGGDVPHSGSGFRVVEDTWVWNGVAWRERKPKSSPGPRFMHALAYHAERKQVVLYGGVQNASQDDVWGWDGEDWSRVG